MDKVVVETTLGNAEATRDKTSEAWDIGYPWGDDRFYGTKKQVEARMRKNIKENDDVEDE